MSRHHIRLLLCAAASVALIGGALFVVEWFDMDVAFQRVTIDLRSARVCVADEGCHALSLARTGVYRFVAAIAFWSSLPVLLLVLVQTFGKLVTGATNPTIGRLGVSLGGFVFVSAFAAAYLFGPDTDGLFETMGVVVSRTLAAPMLLGGSFLAIVTFRYAQHDDADDEAGEYKPVVVKPNPATGRFPAVAHQRERIVSPAGSDRVRITTPGGSEPVATSEARVRITTPGAVAPLAAPGARDRISTPVAVERIPLPGRDPAPGSTSDNGPIGEPASSNELRDDAPSERTRSPSQPPLVARTTSSSGLHPRALTEPPTGSGTSLSQPLVARTSSSSGLHPRAPTEPPPGGGTSPSQPLVARTSSSSGLHPRAPTEPPTGSGTSLSQPLVARTASPMSRTRSPSDQPAVARTTSPSGQPAIARTTSPSGRLHAHSEPPISIAIKPPLPEPAPVPPGQIPVAPESGLVIRKRTTSSGPLASSQQIPIASSQPIPIASDAGSGSPAYTPAAPPADTSVSTAESKAEPTTPHALRGTLRYAVTSAKLTSAGVQAELEDGTHKLVEWEAIVAIIARRLPNDAPYDGATLVDLVSGAGSTLRILPWTEISGAPVHGQGESRARAFVQLVAAHCLDAKLDGWTRVFADGAGHAAQLANLEQLAEHDNKVA